MTVVAVAAAMLWLPPYGWPDGNHAQEIPPILAMLDSSFAGDFAVQSFLGPTPRSAYQLAIASLARLGLSLPAAYLLLQCMAMTAAAAMLFRLGGWMTGRSRLPGLIVALPLAFWIVAMEGRGWSLTILNARSALPSTFAMGFALWGWWFAVRRKWGPSFALFGLAAILQFLVGFIPIILLSPIIVHDLRRARGARIKPVIGGAFLWAACLLLVAGPMLVADHVPAGSEEIIRIFGRVRAPHHWLPSSAGEDFWLNQTALFLGGLALAWRMPQQKQAGRVRAIALATISMTAALIVANYVLVELLPLSFVAKLQLQRALPFGTLAVLVVLAWHVAQSVQQHRPLFTIAALLAPLSGVAGLTIGLVALAWYAGGVLSRRSTILVDAVALMAIVAAGTAEMPFDFIGGLRSALLAVSLAGAVLAIARMGAVRSSRILLVAGSAIILATGLVFALHTSLDRTSAGPFIARNGPVLSTREAIPVDVQRLAMLLRERTPVEAVILAPPLPSLEFLQLESRRSFVLTWKNIPYTDAGIVEWGARLDSILGSRHTGNVTERSIAAEWGRRSTTDLESIGRSYGASFIIDRTSRPARFRGSLVASTDGWSVWALSDGGSSRRVPGLMHRPATRFGYSIRRLGRCIPASRCPSPPK